MIPPDSVLIVASISWLAYRAALWLADEVAPEPPSMRRYSETRDAFARRARSLKENR